MGSVLAAGPAGALIDRLGAERILAPALIGSSAAMASFPLASDWSQICVAIALWQAARTVLNLAPSVLAAQSVAPEARSQTLAMLRTTGDLGFMLGGLSVGLAGSVLGA